MKYLQQHPVNRVQFWINVFIPGEVPGLTQTVKAGPHAGKSFIPHPVMPVFGYLTDQRDFSSDLKASSRLHSFTTVFLNGIYPQVIEQHQSSRTHEISVDPTGILPDWTTGIPTGDTEAKDWTQGEAMGLIPSKGQLRRPWVHVDDWNPNTRVLTLVAAASGGNPCAPTTKLGGEVDYNGKVWIDLRAMTIRFRGHTDPLPNYEMYAQVDDEAPVAVFRRSVKDADLNSLAKGFLSLVGPANTPIDSGTVALRPAAFPALPMPTFSVGGHR